MNLSDNNNQEQAVLKNRARLLATPAVAAVREGIACIVFTLGQERFALETQHLRGAVQLRHWRRLYHTPLHLPGIANVQGQILGITDLRPLLGLPVAYPEHPLALILAGPVWQTALLIEDLKGPRRLHLPETELKDNSERKFVRATCTDSTHLLDAQKIFADPRFILNQIAG